MTELDTFTAAGTGVLMAVFVIYKLGRTEWAFWAGAATGLIVTLTVFRFIQHFIGAYLVVTIYITVCLFGPWLYQLGFRAKHQFQEVTRDPGTALSTRNRDYDQLLEQLRGRIEGLEGLPGRIDRELAVFHDDDASEEERRAQARYLGGEQ
jgi:hypothetical protein